MICDDPHNLLWFSSHCGIGREARLMAESPCLPCTTQKRSWLEWRVVETAPACPALPLRWKAIYPASPLAIIIGNSRRPICPIRYMWP